MAGVTDQDAVTFSQLRDQTQIQFRIIRRISAACVDEDQVLLAEDFDGVIELVERAHAGGKHDWFAGLAGAPQERVVCQRSGSDFVTGHGKLLDKIDRRLIPARGKPRDFGLRAERIDRAILFEAELEAAFEIAVGRTERIFPRRRQLFRRVDNLDRALLKLDRVPARVLRGRDQLFRQLDVSIMIDPDLADEIARMTVADELQADLDFAHDRMYPVFRAAVSNRNRQCGARQMSSRAAPDGEGPYGRSIAFAQLHASTSRGAGPLQDETICRCEVPRRLRGSG